MSKEDYLRKEDEGMGGGQDVVTTERKEEMGEEGVKVQGGEFNLGSGMLCYEPRCECVLCSGSTSEGVFLPLPASYISRMLIIERDTT